MGGAAGVSIEMQTELQARAQRAHYNDVRDTMAKGFFERGSRSPFRKIMGWITDRSGFNPETKLNGRPQAFLKR